MFSNESDKISPTIRNIIRFKFDCIETKIKVIRKNLKYNYEQVTDCNNKVVDINCFLNFNLTAHRRKIYKH